MLAEQKRCITIHIRNVFVFWCFDPGWFVMCDACNVASVTQCNDLHLSHFPSPGWWIASSVATSLVQTLSLTIRTHPSQWQWLIRHRVFCPEILQYARPLIQLLGVKTFALDIYLLLLCWKIKVVKMSLERNLERDYHAALYSFRLSCHFR